MYRELGQLTATYSQELGVGGMLEAIERGGLLGRGVGANTIAARHGLDPASAVLFQGGYAMVENYYAKAVIELGAVGLVVLVLCAVLMLIACLLVQRRLVSRPLKNVAACGTALTAFVMMLSVKGAALDSEPLNYYYYLLLGMVFALPHVERQMTAAVAGSYRIGGPQLALRGQPAMAGPAGYRPLIGRRGHYGTVGRRPPTHVPPDPRDERASTSRGRDDPADGNS
jgi:hypothetical protein